MQAIPLMIQRRTGDVPAQMRPQEAARAEHVDCEVCERLAGRVVRRARGTAGVQEDAEGAVEGDFLF